MAAAHHTAHHTNDERARQSIQRMIALAMIVSPPRWHTGRDRDAHTHYPHDQPDQPRATRRIVRTVGAVARLPNARLHATGNPAWKAVSPLVQGMEALVQ
ncbi:hypothetical protein [Chloroflexus sp.]|uniref:hypothetical protein n=1 Tax=Chloroflexus sp. TaxID=1904827 RepID=UPI002ADDEA39|nr:hypothetical protein [Chloroflexus sp.]